MRRDADMRYAPEWIRSQALAAAARSTVNPGNVIRIATRYAYFIEHGTDPGEGMQMADANENPAVDRCPECGHSAQRHNRHGCHATVGIETSHFSRCPCRLPHGICSILDCRDHSHV